MRPNTLAEAIERIGAGSARDAVLAEFVDTFDLAKTDQDRYASIEQEPKLTGDARLTDPARRLTSPWFTAASPSDAMREYLTFASPAEFASRNIFTEERPLRRARDPQAAKT